MDAVSSIASEKDPVIAAKAEILLNKDLLPDNLSFIDRRLVAEILLPLKIHFDRTSRAFKMWIDLRPSQPNLELEDAIKESNIAIKEVLTDNWHLIPPALFDDASALITHYNAWLDEYVALRPNGVRATTPKYVFVGPKGFPFPRDAEQNFLNYYINIVQNKTDSPSA